MTYGHWLDQATQALRAAATESASLGIGELLEVTAARRQVYLALARHAAILTNHPRPPDHLGRANPTPTPAPTGETASPPAGLVPGLRLAAGSLAAQPPAATAPATQLRRAAEHLHVAADLLATHVPPRARPRTVAGAAIRAGAGTARTLADLAALTTLAIQADRELLRRVRRSQLTDTAGAVPLLAAIDHARTGHLPRLLSAITAAGADQPALLRDLDPAPAPGRPVTAIASLSDATTALRAAHTWIWQHPDQIQVAHVHLATRLGLAITAAAHDGTPATRARAPWRSATIAAQDLHGLPAHRDTHPVTDALRDLTAWVTAHLPQPTPALAPLRDELVALAHALDAGLHHAVNRGDVFVRDHRLTGHARHLIVHARSTWRAATQADQSIAIIRNGLRDATTDGAGAAERPTGVARLAFTQPLRLVGDATVPHQAGPQPGAGATRRRHR